MTLKTAPQTTVAPETVTPLRLSEAIRLGSLETEQCFDGMFEAPNGACALGAAAIALGSGRDGIEDFDSGWDRVMAAFPELVGEWRGLSKLAGTIVHWNDRDRLSRSEIADRLEAMGY